MMISHYPRDSIQQQTDLSEHINNKESVHVIMIQGTIKLTFVCEHNGADQRARIGSLISALFIPIWKV